ncbi:hypothetical protein OGATHE_003502 [Ogataea polymorpha]|uniref:Uncharacterized protein n=1 Tax=Ogataea polymorpha TaxID=460523 RepID=A0A9P8P3Q5_9ASCO|nr:hypothetical protein OGATHE_003502 [Ogataea polymorpha]
MVDMHFPSLGSQNFTKLSLEPLTTNPKVGCQSQALTSQWCPFKVRSSVAVLKFHILSVRSSEQLTNFESFGEKTMS